LQNESPSQDFAKSYIEDAKEIIEKVKAYRNADLAQNVVI